MALSKKPGLIYFATQPGATFENFDALRCHREIVTPARKLLGEKDLVYQIVFVIVCDRRPSVSRDSEEVRFSEGRPGHIKTRTCEELLESMRSERSEHLFEYLHIPRWGDDPPPIFYFATQFAWTQGVDGVIICPIGSPFPTPDDVTRVATQLEIGQVLTLPSVPVSA